MRFALIITIFALFSCKQRQEQSTLNEAGAGHIGNEQWFARFDVKFNPEKLLPKVFRISQVSKASEKNLLSNFKGWPKEHVPNRDDLYYLSSTATGFVISSDGFALTNYHVIDECVNYKKNKLAVAFKCNGMKAISALAFQRDNYSFSKLETKINNELVDIANSNMEELSEDNRSLNGGLANEIDVRVYSAIRSKLGEKEIWDVCVFSFGDSDFDAALVRFVREGKSCNDNVSFSDYWKMSKNIEIKTGQRVFSVGFGSSQSLYSHHKRDSKSDHFESMKPNFSTGIVGRVSRTAIHTVSDKSVYSEDQNFEAMDSNSGHSGSPVFTNDQIPSVVGVHSLGSNMVRVHEQTSVSTQAIKDAFLEENCLLDYYSEAGKLNNCLKK